jgi:hypothetical protein
VTHVVNPVKAIEDGNDENTAMEETLSLEDNLKKEEIRKVDEVQEDQVDTAIQAMEDELTCGMCAGLYIDVSHRIGSYHHSIAPADLTARRTQRLRPRVLRKLCSALDQGKLMSIAPIGADNPQSIPPYPASLGPDDPVIKPLSCPHCRHTPITSASPSRVARAMVDVLIQQRPAAARSTGEIAQANGVYAPKSKGHLKVSFMLCRCMV